MKYARVKNRAIYEEWANSVGTGLDKLHDGRTKFALFLTLLSVGNMWRTNTPARSICIDSSQVIVTVVFHLGCLSVYVIYF